MIDKQLAQIQTLLEPIKDFIYKDDKFEVPDVVSIDGQTLTREYQRALDYHSELATHAKNAYLVISLLTQMKNNADINTPRGSNVSKQATKYLAYMKAITDALSYIDAKMYRILNFYERQK